MKIPKIGIALLLLMIIGLTIFIRILIQQEERSNISNLQMSQEQLVSML